MEIKFGVGLPYHLHDFKQLTKIANATEKRGFDSIWIADHGYLPWEALTTLSAIAMKTETIRIGTAITDLNRRNPATLAQMVSTLDTISNGRFLFGVGSGVPGINPWGIKVSHPVSRMRESLKIIKKFWTQSEVTHEGRYYHFEKASISVKPKQKPHPPIWVAAFRPKLMKVAAELGNGLICQCISPEIFGELLTEVKHYVTDMKKDPARFTGMFAAPMSLSHDYWTTMKAIEPIARDWMTSSAILPQLAQRLGYENQWINPEDIPNEAIDQCFIIGTPEDWITKIEQYIKSGVTYFVATRLLPLTTKSLDLYFDHVVSHFRT